MKPSLNGARERISRKHDHIKGHFSHLLSSTLPSVSPEITPQDNLASLSFLQNRVSKLTFDNKGLVKVRKSRFVTRARVIGLTRQRRRSPLARARTPVCAICAMSSRQPSALDRARACLICRASDLPELLARLMAIDRRAKKWCDLPTSIDNALNPECYSYRAPSSAPHKHAAPSPEDERATTNLSARLRQELVRSRKHDL